MKENKEMSTSENEREYFFIRKKKRNMDEYCAYDYRHTDSELFSCVKPTLSACRAARDEWVKGRV